MTQITNTNQAAPALQGNPFAAVQKENINQGTVQIEEARAISEAQGKLIIAKRFPRDQAKAYEQIMASCSRKGMAENAMYQYPRGGESITGPSIRLAEELARAWGNMDFGVRELSQRVGESEMEAYCWDLETNVSSSQKFTVKHERHTKKGITKLVDPRDIYELTANQAGRRLRARILAVIPPDLVAAAVERCNKTLIGDVSEPIQDTVRKMLNAFSAYGITKQHIEIRIGKSLDMILREDVVELKNIYASIKDGIASASAFFGGSNNEAAPADESAIGKLNAKVEAENVAPVPETPAKAKPKAKPQPPQEQPVPKTEDMGVPIPDTSAPEAEAEDIPQPPADDDLI
jgi:hypothetical protein